MQPSHTMHFLFVNILQASRVLILPSRHETSMSTKKKCDDVSCRGNIILRTAVYLSRIKKRRSTPRGTLNTSESVCEYRAGQAANETKHIRFFVVAWANFFVRFRNHKMPWSRTQHSHKRTSNLLLACLSACLLARFFCCLSR